MTDEASIGGQSGDGPPPGWYPNPSGAPGIRYFDGQAWTPFHRPDPVPAPRPVMPPHQYGVGQTSAGAASVIVAGPNHVLHAVMTLLTFWACGGWAWIWLIVAIGDRRRVHVLGPPPSPPPPPRW